MLSSFAPGTIPLRHEVAVIRGTIRRVKANLPRPCAVNVTPLWTLDRSRLVEKIGAVSPTKREVLLQGIALVMGIG